MTRPSTNSGLLFLLVCCLAALVLPSVWAQDPPPPAAPPPPPAQPPEKNIRLKPLQVEVSVKIIEFQVTKGLETGLSAYFQKLPRAQTFGRVSTSGNAIETADLTFPTSTAAGLTVFLDRIMLGAGDIEVVIQALVDENRAFILANPKAQVIIADGDTPTVIKTAQQIPYENTQVVGVVAQQITDFEDTGVTLSVTAPEVIDFDGDWATRDDTYVRLTVDTNVVEEGQRIVVSLDDRLAGGLGFDQGRNQISVPEFISRGIKTQIWVSDGQILLLGGLFRNSESRSLTTLPWLTQAEDVAIGLAERIVPGNALLSPLSSTFGSRSVSETRRELVFIIKCEIWDPSSTFANDLGFDDTDSEGRKSTTDAVRDILDGIKELPQGIAEGLTPPAKEGSVESDLGGIKE